ncbi:sensor histidine kinase [Paraclostridium ghonii]|uniref:histidine kinase n=1 Tax=Paraclostridium ghonii TaxID=29358 RepID=A0ABU0N1Y1_9FIRM|nr:HAMP domain-containing sensor histidine kinase [Paeniclostridium ghonii]MDQ0557126.1 signal transduction histidine kinase [Paeniclostridium ghonii]
MMNKNILKNTRKKLITLNTLVVGVVFILFTLFIYKFFYDLTYNGVDKDLHMQLQKVENDLMRGNMKPLPNNDEMRMMSKGSFVYVWENGKLIKSYPYDIANYIKPYEKSKDLNEGIISYEYDGSYFRELKKVSGPYTIEVIKMVDIEEGLLAKLRHVLIISGFIAFAAVFITSKFLTRKSLEPIESSWKTQALFVQDASHELRTPLTIIFSKIESIIKRPNNSVEDEMKNLTIVMKEVRRLNKLVSDLLKLTKEDAIVTINKSKFDLKSMIIDIIEQYEDICELQNKTLIFEYNLKDDFIFNDKEKLKQILIIFIDNAIKYTNYKDIIKLTIFEENTNIVINIEDSGIGIKKEDLPLIFNRFFRSSSHRETNREGSGIGLSIARVLVSNLSGKISVKSEYRKGSTFSISIPRK